MERIILIVFYEQIQNANRDSQALPLEGAIKKNDFFFEK
jgi:hypothetical protein